jgi:hypothetical protein
VALIDARIRVGFSCAPGWGGETTTTLPRGIDSMLQEKLPGVCDDRPTGAALQKESERPPDAVPLPDRRGSPASATGRRQELPKVLGFTTTKHVLKVIQSTWLCSTEIKDRKGQEHNPSHGDQGGRQAGDSERLSRRFRRRKPVTYRFSNMWGMFSASLRPDYVSGYGS